MSAKRVEAYKKKLQVLESDASQRDDWINRIDHYAVPHLYNYQNDGGTSRSNLPDDIYDSEMVQASFEFSNLFFSYLTNPSSQWLQTTVSQDKLKESGVKDALESVDKKIRQGLSLTNFYSSMHQCYYSLVKGNCVLYREKSPDQIARYYALPLSECYFEYDNKNKVNSMYRKVKKTSLQIVEEFPKTAHEKVRKEAKSEKGSTLHDCLHIVKPRWQRDVKKKDKLNKAYESIWIDLDNITILKEDGYDNFPYFVGHYLRDPHSPYSYGPAHLCFYDAKSLNQLALAVLRRASKEADPVTNLPHDGFMMPYLTDPGDINYRTSDDPKDKAEYMMPPPASAAVNENLITSRDKIKRAFFVDLYRSLQDSTKRMTTVEVQQLIADRAPMLGPAVWNLTTDFINYIVDDFITLLVERGDLDEEMAILGGETFGLKYLSPLARAQQVSEFQSLQAFLQFLGGAIQFNQDVVDIVDWDNYTRTAADTTGIPQDIIKENGVVSKDRKEKQKLIAAQQQRQELLQVANAAKDATQADKNISEAQGG